MPFESLPSHDLQIRQEQFQPLPAIQRYPILPFIAEALKPLAAKLDELSPEGRQKKKLEALKLNYETAKLQQQQQWLNNSTGNTAVDKDGVPLYYQNAQGELVPMDPIRKLDYMKKRQDYSRVKGAMDRGDADASTYNTVASLANQPTPVQQTHTSVATPDSFKPMNVDSIGIPDLNKGNRTPANTLLPDVRLGDAEQVVAPDYQEVDTPPEAYYA